MDEAEFLFLFVIFMKMLKPIRVLSLATQKRDVILIKGILRSIVCININTGNGKLCKNISVLLTFFLDIITPVILSTQIICDVMYVQHAIH